MKSSRNRPPFLLATAACAGLLAVVPSTMSAAATSTHPTPGAAGIGDSLFPTLGNGGYDAQHYDLALRYATSAPTQGIDGTVTMHAVATQSLSRFDLDFSGKSVGSVTVNAAPARFERNGEELVITPASRPGGLSATGVHRHPGRLRDRRPAERDAQRVPLERSLPGQGQLLVPPRRPDR